MPRKKSTTEDRTTELLEKVLIVHLHGLGVPQNKIAKMVGRQAFMVNAFLKGVPRPGKK